MKNLKNSLYLLCLNYYLSSAIIVLTNSSLPVAIFIQIVLYIWVVLCQIFSHVYHFKHFCEVGSVGVLINHHLSLNFQVWKLRPREFKWFLPGYMGHYWQSQGWYPAIVGNWNYYLLLYFVMEGCIWTISERLKNIHFYSSIKWG